MIILLYYHLLILHTHFASILNIYMYYVYKKLYIYKYILFSQSLDTLFRKSRRLQSPSDIDTEMKTSRLDKSFPSSLLARRLSFHGRDESSCTIGVLAISWNDAYHGKLKQNNNLRVCERYRYK